MSIGHHKEFLKLKFRAPSLKGCYCIPLERLDNSDSNPPLKPSNSSWLQRVGGYLSFELIGALWPCGEF